MDNDGTPLKEFNGHTNIVNSISQSEPGYFISGSWDNTAKVWDTNSGECLYTLEDHSYAVTVLSIKGQKFLTASQDKKIKFWEKNNLIRTISNAHDDIIRDLKLTTNGFYSCSNDQIIKRWSMDGVVQASLSGHEGFIFAIFPYDNWLFSGGDDRFLRTWLDGENKQCLIHPNTIWDVCVNNKGEVITACADGVVRIFSSKENEWLDKASIEEYEKLCFESMNQGQEQGGEQVDANSLPKLSDGMKTVGKEGEIRIFNNNGVAEAYVYKSDLKTWQKIGEVLGKKDNKKFYPGDKAFKQGDYDFIFDVELEGRTSVIPFNKGDNCLVAAEKFCVREGLHRGYIDEITKWLRKQSSGQATATQASNQAAISQAKVPQKNQIYQSDKIKFPKVRFLIKIKINYTKFDSVNIEGPLKKIIEFNSKLENTAPHFLSENELKSLKTMLETIKNAQFYHTSSFSDFEINLLHKKLGYFPDDCIIPYLDIFRMFLLHPRSHDMFKKMGGGYGEYARIMDLLKSTSNDNVRTLVMRILCNFFLHEATRNLLASRRADIFDLLANYIDCENKTVRGSMISVFFNFTVLIYDKIDADTCLQLLSLLNEDLKNVNNILLSFGNLLFSNDKNRAIAKDMSLLANIKEVKIDQSAETNDKNTFNELKTFFTKVLN